MKFELNMEYTQVTVTPFETKNEEIEKTFEFEESEVNEFFVYLATMMNNQSNIRRYNFIHYVDGDTVKVSVRKVGRD